MKTWNWTTWTSGNGGRANSGVLETCIKAFVNRKDETIGHIFLKPDLPIILVLKQDLLGQELDSKQWVRNWNKCFLIKICFV